MRAFAKRNVPPSDIRRLLEPGPVAMHVTSINIGAARWLARLETAVR